MPPAPADTAGRLAAAVGTWLASLDDGQRERAVFPFETDERFAWDYTPVHWQGLMIGDMTAAQREAAFAIVAAGMSERGAAETRAVIALETVLGALERDAGRPSQHRRDPERYWFAVFGDPQSRADGPGPTWSWRIGGHHVTIHQTVVDGVVAGTPSFLGANPAVVPRGPETGRRTLPGEESLGRALLTSLRPDQRSVAVIDPVAPPDILSGTGRRATVDGIAGGIRRGDLDPTQQSTFDGLVRHYLERARHDIADRSWQRVVDGGLDEATFAWAGSDRPGEGHYYAIRGRDLLIEYDDTQNGANHIHAVWRDLTDDWGEDLLRAHYRTHHAGGGSAGR